MATKLVQGKSRRPLPGTLTESLLPSTPPTVRELQRGTSVPIEALLTALYVHRYTGIVTFDFRRGRPLFYSLGKPRRGNLVPAP